MPNAIFSTVTSQANLIDQIETFLAGAGWTIDSSIASPRELWVSRTMDGDTARFAIRADTANSRLRLNAFTGAGGTGPSTDCFTRMPNAAIISAQAFALPKLFHLVIQVTTGIYHHLMLGRLDLAHTPAPGDITGLFVFGHANNEVAGFFSPIQTRSGCVRSRDSSGARWIIDHDSDVSGYSGGSGPNATRLLAWMGANPNTSGLRAQMPLTIYALESPAPTLGNARFILGTVPDVRIQSTFNIQSGSDEVIGSDTWVRYQLFNDGTIQSRTGIAIKKTP